ncbi:MAG: hypothetical protein WCG93_01365 [Paludibacter sp.]
MKQFKTLLITLIFVGLTTAQNNSRVDLRGAAQNTIVKIDASQNTWSKGDNDSPTGVNSQITGTENVTFSSNPEGIFVTIISGTNKIKLFALTGQLLLNGDLRQGSFFIPTRKGIYFLRVNNRSFKVICK